MRRRRAVAVGKRQALAGVGQTARKPVAPQATVGIDHDLHHAGLFEPFDDRRAKVVRRMRAPSTFRETTPKVASDLSLRAQRDSNSGDNQKGP
jgi:hypothetical protein